MYSMHNTKYIRIFAYWGNHVYHEGHTTSYQETNTNNNDVKYYGSTRYNTGVGFGFSFGRVVAFNISVGYGAYNVFGGSENLSLLPTGEVGLYWRF